MMDLKDECPDELLRECGMTAISGWSDWAGQDDYGPGEMMISEAVLQVERRGPDAQNWLIAECHKLDWLHNGGPEDILRWRKVRRNPSG